ncbi:DUF1186 domain-containing protein, partial [Candidatus Sumerlaeota bacterium]|nr:DUF1186 domain-containing protein [Candidatus Sumerlaeota bacterium]
FASLDRRDYRQLGLTEAHIPELIRIATDLKLLKNLSDTPAAWAPVHAWRALGQLRAVAAVKPLLDLYEKLTDDDWLVEELPKVLGAIGAGAFNATAAYLENETSSLDGRITALSSLSMIAERDPESRGRCVEAARKCLRGFRNNPPDLNAFAVCALVDMNARETLPLIERAYREDAVDQTVIDWDSIERRFGFKTTRPDLIPPPGNIFD